jgi:hypothetical protein
MIYMNVCIYKQDNVYVRTPTVVNGERLGWSGILRLRRQNNL